LETFEEDFRSLKKMQGLKDLRVIKMDNMRLKECCELKANKPKKSRKIKEKYQYYFK